MLLSVEDLRTEFRTEEGVVRAVDGVSFQLDQGRTLGIVGESGCGKSVTAMSILRLLAEPPARIAGGRIVFKGRDLLTLSRDEMCGVRGGEIGMIFQEPMTSLNPVYPIGAQIAEAIRLHRREVPARELRARTVGMLAQVGIAEPERRYDDYPHQLSGGLRQRVMIAMALSCDPELLIADVPTTALDVTIQAQILELIGRLQGERGMSVLLITHDLGVVAETTDDVLVMYAGRVAEKAPVGELFAHPLHPYTRGLLDSLPSRRGEKLARRSRLPGIPGSVPSLLRLPVGCRFQDRCPSVTARCRAREPVPEEKRPGHWVSCFEVEG
jgi:oligopeptide/dipeptide ABC transporter ATP-binding protein